ncbi:class I SAM-dependent methyltransferase [Laspinema sp. A4]|uniref:SAM-dependent methyltransferase n=1 Tax=Laspinema sp. D2d TaxID=2953686 RepID=UPI0021BB784B|nr:class I SAM-dependent methyltransferase [Laspinema sp. D2d]MCT7985013.1 class I SAM-dependent methyltransferase [Laspinema sp. D2d]
MDLEALFTVHCNLPREGPGSDEATREAIRRLPPLPRSPKVLDLGCGPGRQSLVLAQELNTTVIAVDLHEPFLKQLEGSAVAVGLRDRITIRQADMGALDYPPGSFDLIWSEGAVYLLGFSNGLRLWRPLLRDGGLVVVSECTWIQDNPPREVWEYWQVGYPEMMTIKDNIKIATEAGYEVLDTFILPRSAWWDEYLNPLSHRVQELRKAGNLTPALSEVLTETERELDICDRYSEFFGYVFYLMQKPL